MLLSVSHPLLPKSPSTHASLVMDHFGISLETGRHIIAEKLDLPIQPGDIVCFTGSSGSGKSSLMKAAARQLDQVSKLVGGEFSYSPVEARTKHTEVLKRPVDNVLDIEDLDLGKKILADSLKLPFQESLHLLSTCGLSEAQLLLRTPTELSDGQRYRFRLALALSKKPSWILADEFTATLDRTLAKVIACNLRRLSNRTGTGFLLATTHEDILPDLQPTLHVRCSLDGHIEHTRNGVKKKASASPHKSGSVAGPSPTGRTSLAGITEATTSA